MAIGQTLHGVLVLLLAGALGWAGVAKLGAAAEFQRALAVLLPAGARPVVRFGLPVVELTLAGALLAGFAPQAVAAAVAALLAVFMLAQYRLMRRGHVGGCGCFGHAPDGGGEVLRTALLLAAAVMAVPLAGPQTPSVLTGGGELLGQPTVVLGVVLTWSLGRAVAGFRVAGVR